MPFPCSSFQKYVAIVVLEALLKRPFTIRSDEEFNALALELFHLHAERNTVYRGFLSGLKVDPGKVERVDQIPFLPIGLFRSHTILLDGLEATLRFASSGTTGAPTSHHYLPWPGVYERSILAGFRRVYGDPAQWRIVALIPSHLERKDSSLAWMMDRLIGATDDPLSGVFGSDLDRVGEILRRSEREGRKTLVVGVSFALLDLAEKHAMPLKHTTVVETGGMKGRRQELVREELHQILSEAFGLASVHSEYGMTELLSQAWSTGSGLFSCPPWMRVQVRDVNDPLHALGQGRTGGIDVIDLCNIGSCPFISTQDLGRMHANGSFEVLGRFDHSDLRGCNLLVA